MNLFKSFIFVRVLQLSHIYITSDMDSFDSLFFVVIFHTPQCVRALCSLFINLGIFCIIQIFLPDCKYLLFYSTIIWMQLTVRFNPGI